MHPHPTHPHPHREPSGCKTPSEYTRPNVVHEELCMSLSILIFQYIFGWELHVSIHSSV